MAKQSPTQEWQVGRKTMGNSLKQRRWIKFHQMCFEQGGSMHGLIFFPNRWPVIWNLWDKTRKTVSCPREHSQGSAATWFCQLFHLHILRSPTSTDDKSRETWLVTLEGVKAIFVPLPEVSRCLAKVTKVRLFVLKLRQPLNMDLSKPWIWPQNHCPKSIQILATCFFLPWILGNLSKQKQRTMLANSDRDPMDELRRRPGCAASDTGSNSWRTVKKLQNLQFTSLDSIQIAEFMFIQSSKSCRRKTCLLLIFQTSGRAGAMTRGERPSSPTCWLGPVASGRRVPERLTKNCGKSGSIPRVSKHFQNLQETKAQGQDRFERNQDFCQRPFEAVSGIAGTVESDVNTPHFWKCRTWPRRKSWERKLLLQDCLLETSPTAWFGTSGLLVYIWFLKSRVNGSNYSEVLLEAMSAGKMFKSPQIQPFIVGTWIQLSKSQANDYSNVP